MSPIGALDDYLEQHEGDDTWYDLLKLRKSKII